MLASRWQGLDAAQHLEDTVLHYLDGKIHVEVSLPFGEMGSATETRALINELCRLAREETVIADVQINFHQDS